MGSNARKMIALTNSGEKVNASAVSQHVASAAVKSSGVARDSASMRVASGVPGLAVEAASAPEWREPVAGGEQRLTRRRSGLGTNVAAYEAHENACASLRNASGSQPLNAIR